MPGPWVLGVLASQLWTFADSGGPPHVNLFVLQYFVNYNLARGWAISSAPIITANWSMPSGERWTVPFGAGITKVTALGKQPLSLGLQYYYNVTRPTDAGASQVRFQITRMWSERRPAPGCNPAGGREQLPASSRRARAVSYLAYDFFISSK
jgi:hypothetical protein